MENIHIRENITTVSQLFLKASKCTEAEGWNDGTQY